MIRKKKKIKEKKGFTIPFVLGKIGLAAITGIVVLIFNNIVVDKFG
jgi:hypothetical protein